MFTEIIPDACSRTSSDLKPCKNTQRNKNGNSPTHRMPCQHHIMVGRKSNDGININPICHLSKTPMCMPCLNTFQLPWRTASI